ncbi:MAG: ATP-binding protein [Anaerolineales bacterium]
MSSSFSSPPLASFASFGEMLKYLRRRARLSQRELSIAVGYSESQISRLENNQSAPDPATLAALFVPALLIQDEPATAARLLELATAVRAEPAPERAGETTPERRSAAASPQLTNLPQQLTSFVGREKEITEVTRWLSGDSSSGRLYQRLVTLTGAGGCGKTRLALQVASGLVSAYPDGVVLIELAPLSDPALVLQTVAATQDLREIPDRPLAKVLGERLHPKSLLLILDNCEHVIQACAELAETLLRACPKLKLLATSREALNIAGETVLNVPSLSQPEAHPFVDAAGAMQSEAVRLFVDRARAVKPDFKLTNSNAPAVAQICLRLDGIPLAIELAAARLRAMSLEQMAVRLEDRFRLLTGGSRTALPRHQTLTALVDWSYDLLSEAERMAFRRLSVFVGGWTLEGAEAVCAGEGVEAADVLNLLTQLVDKSLVLVEEHKGATRYRLSETIRQYALRRLADSGEAEAIRRRHAVFFRSLAGKTRLRGATWGIWLEKFAIEHDNVRVALDWAFENDPSLASRLVFSIHQLWFDGSLLTEGRRYLTHALKMTKSTVHTRRYLEFLGGIGALAWQQGDYSGTRTAAQECVTLYRAAGNTEMFAVWLGFLGKMTELVEGPSGAALSLQEERVAIFRATGNKLGLAEALYFLAASLAAQGDETKARALLEESVVLYQESGNPLLVAPPLGYLGYQALRLGKCAEARSLFIESLTLARGWHSWGVAWRLEGFAALAVKEEEPERAARLYGASEALLDSVGAKLDAIDRLGYDQYVATAREQLGKAAFDKAWAEGRMMSMQQAIALALNDRVD